jgi:hypothetical protein
MGQGHCTEAGRAGTAGCELRAWRFCFLCGIRFSRDARRARVRHPLPATPLQFLFVKPSEKNWFCNSLAIKHLIHLFSDLTGLFRDFEENRPLRPETGRSRNARGTRPPRSRFFHSHRVANEPARLVLGHEGEYRAIGCGSDTREAPSATFATPNELHKTIVLAPMSTGKVARLEVKWEGVL